jgi:hypothetical protein
MEHGCGLQLLYNIPYLWSCIIKHNLVYLFVKFLLANLSAHKPNQAVLRSAMGSWNEIISMRVWLGPFHPFIQLLWIIGNFRVKFNPNTCDKLLFIGRIAVAKCKDIPNLAGHNLYGHGGKKRKMKSSDEMSHPKELGFIRKSHPEASSRRVIQKRHPKESPGWAKFHKEGSSERVIRKSYSKVSSTFYKNHLEESSGYTKFYPKESNGKAKFHPEESSKSVSRRVIQKSHPEESFGSHLANSSGWSIFVVNNYIGIIAVYYACSKLHKLNKIHLTSSKIC